MEAGEHAYLDGEDVEVVLLEVEESAECREDSGLKERLDVVESAGNGEYFELTARLRERGCDSRIRERWAEAGGTEKGVRG